MESQVNKWGRLVASPTFIAFVLLVPVLLFLVIFFIGPLAVNFKESTNFGGSSASLGQFKRIFTDIYYLKVLGQTILLGLVVTFICIVIGYPLAYAIVRSTGVYRAGLIFAVVAPLLINVVVRSYGWMVMLGGRGVINGTLHFFGLPAVEFMYSWTAILIAMVHVLLPFMALAIASKLETVDRDFEDAARVLGASDRQVFLYVTLPLSVEGIVTGSILTFTLTIGSFVTVMLLGDTGTMVLPLLIYQQLTVASDWPFAAALGIVLLVFVVSILWFQSQLRHRTEWYI
jgi:ABC-type spermidine/putrescine transport system permease subunit I